MYIKCSFPPYCFTFPMNNHINVSSMHGGTHFISHDLLSLWWQVSAVVWLLSAALTKQRTTVGDHLIQPTNQVILVTTGTFCTCFVAPKAAIFEHTLGAVLIAPEEDILDEMLGDFPAMFVVIEVGIFLDEMLREIPVVFVATKFFKVIYDLFQTLTVFLVPDQTSSTAFAQHKTEMSVEKVST